MLSPQLLVFQPPAVEGTDEELSPFFFYLFGILLLMWVP